jgi:hypothetical protein
MAEPSPLSPLEAALAAVVSLLRSKRVRGIVIGGVAASLLGRPRTTRDVDALVWIEDPRHWAAFLSSARSMGLVPRIKDPLAFAERSRVLLLRHMPSGIDVDVALAALPFEEEAIGRAVPLKLGRLRVPLPTPEDLIIMKAVAHRPRDTADIEGILDAQPNVDVTRVRRWVEQFATALEAPELVANLEMLLVRSEKNRPRARVQTATIKAAAKRRSRAAKTRKTRRRS